MTDLRYGVLPTSDRLPQPSAWKPVLTVLAAVLGPPAAAFTAFAAHVTWTDCFLSCSGNPDHLRGGLLWVLAAALLLAGPVLAAVLMRSGAWVAATVATPFAGAALLWLRWS